MSVVKPFTVLTTIAASSGAYEYEIRISHQTGVTYCTCRGWQFRKTCKHLDAYNAAPSIDVAGLVAKDKQKTKAVPLKAPALLPKSTDAIVTGTPEWVMTSEIGKLGFSLKPVDARRIVGQLRASLAAAATKLKTVPTAVETFVDEVNSEGVRRIVLPD